MGLFSFLGSIFGGNAAKDASEKAMQAQTDASNRGIDTQNAQYQQTRTDYMPYTSAGTGAINQLSGALGLTDPAAREKFIQSLSTDPLYKARYDAGQEAILQSGSATGGLRGGNMQRGLADFGSNVLASVYDDQLSRLAGVSQLGLGATGSVAGFGAHTADATTVLNGQIGDAQARNYITRGGLTANQWNSAGSFLDQAAGAAMGAGAGAGGAPFSLSNALTSIFK